jgi:excisionase family DNA binding protein
MSSGTKIAARPDISRSETAATGPRGVERRQMPTKAAASAVGRSTIEQGKETRWVNLARACEMLGVYESTLRRWSDSGQIRCYRTPGGHRRFAEHDLLELVEGSSLATDRRFERTALSSIQRQLEAGEGDEWRASIERPERELFKHLGRRLVFIINKYVSSDVTSDALEAEVERIGCQYGRTLHDRGMPLSQAIRAFAFFRRSLDEAAKEQTRRRSMSAADSMQARERIARLADRVLVGLSRQYEARRARE